jgi:hypothetical protein
MGISHILRSSINDQGNNMKTVCCCIAVEMNSCRLVLLWVVPNRERSVFILLRWSVIDVNMWGVMQILYW